jgi:predicted ArsR family transcriptional regulator
VTAPAAGAAALQRQAKALGDPTRYAIFCYLRDTDRPVDIAELTEHLEVHHNAIRQHLAKLVEADLVVEGKAPSTGRGRPRLRYSVGPAADARWGAGGPYERLSLLLTEIIRSGDSPIEVGRRAVRPRRLGAPPSTAATAVDDLVEEMARQGFEPQIRHRGERFEVELQACPFASSAAADPDTVCNLHLGMAYGVADEVGGLQVDELVPHDPMRGHCQLHGHMAPPKPVELEASPEPATS